MANGTSYSARSGRRWSTGLGADRLGTARGHGYTDLPRVSISGWGNGTHMARRAGVSLGTKLILGTVLLLAVAVGSSAWYGMNTLDQFAQASGNARRQDLEGAI